MQKVWFTLETANQIVGYLGTKPYQEVFQLMEQIQKAVNVQQKEEEEGLAPEAEIEINPEKEKTNDN
jgi:hypothetical protein